MKNKFFVLFLSIFIFGCSAKIQSNKFADGSVEYNDSVNGAEIKFRMKDGKCYPDARIISYGGVTADIKLSELCNVIEIKRYLNGKYYDDGSAGNRKEALYKEFEAYIQKRRNLVQSGVDF